MTDLIQQIEEMRIRIPEDKLTGEDRRMAPGKPVDAVVLVLTRERFLGGANTGVEEAEH